MSITCPNKNNESWRFLKDKVGEAEAYRFFAANGENIPEMAEVQKYVLDKKLTSMLSKLGVSVETYDGALDRVDNDVQAVADMLDKTVKIAHGAETSDYLPEEAGYFFLEMLKDDKLADRLLDLVRKDDYYIDYLGDRYATYERLYNGDQEMLVREVAGILIGETIGKKLHDRTNTPSVLMRVLDAIWNKIKKFFRNQPRDLLQKEIEEVYGKVAQSVLKEDVTAFEPNKLEGNMRKYFHSNKKKLTGMEKVLNDSIRIVTKRMKLFERKDIYTLAEKDRKLLESLIKDLDAKKYQEGVMNYLNQANDELGRLNDRIIAIREDIDNIDVKEAATTLRDMKFYIKSHDAIVKDLKKEISVTVRPDDMKTVINNINETVELMEEVYADLSAKTVGKTLMPFAANRKDFDMEKTLREADKDIHWWSRYVRSMANANNDFLALIDLLVKRQKNDSRQATRDFAIDILRMQKSLEKAGVKNTDWIYEKDKEGKYTGNIVGEFNTGQYWQDYRQYSNEINANKELSSKQKAQLIAKWIDAHTQAHPKVEEIVAEMKANLPAETFKRWYEANTKQDPATKQITYKGELAIPSNEYKNPEYNKIQSTPHLKEFYDFVANAKEKFDNKLPRRYRKYLRAPQVRKKTIDRMLKARGIKDIKDIAVESLRDTFIVTEDEDERGDTRKIEDVDGKLINFVPTYFTERLSDPNKNMSTDIVSTMIMYSQMANDYSHMNELTDIIELSKDVAADLVIQRTDAKGRPIVEKLDSLKRKMMTHLKMKGSDSNIAVLLKNYIDAQVYGIQKKDEGKIFGNVDVAKMLDFIGRYTSIKYLGLNFFAGFANVNIGSVQVRLEAQAGRFFDHKDLLLGDKEYWSGMPKLITNVGQRLQNSKLQLFMEHFDVLDDFKSSTREINANRKTLFGRLFKSSMLFVINQGGEHYLQGRAALALGQKQNLVDKNGTPISLYEAYEVKDNKLVLKEGVKKSDGSAWSRSDEFIYQEKVHSINQGLHGIYNESDRNFIQQYAIGRLAMMFRKFMIPGIDKRFRSKHYDWRLEEEDEGYLRATPRTLKKLFGNMIRDLRQGDYSFRKNFANLSDIEKASFRRVMLEVGYNMAAFMLLALIGDDDDDDWATAMLAYQLNRFLTELQFYYNPAEAFRIFQSPLAASNAMNDLIDLFTFMMPWKWGEEVKTGRYAGYSRFHRTAIRAIPLYKSLEDLQMPEEKLQFYTK